MANGLINPDKAAEFVLAGNATFTLRSVKTGVRYTYKVKQAENENGAKQDRWFVTLLTGPDNEGDYTYLGMVRDGAFVLTKASKMSMDATPVKAIDWFLSHPANDQVEVFHAGKCGRCGRKLTVPESVESGYGPECIQKVGL